MDNQKYTIEHNPINMLEVPSGYPTVMTEKFSYYPDRTKQINFTVDGEERFVQLYQGSEGFGLLFKRDSGVTRITLSEEAATATFKLLLGGLSHDYLLDVLTSEPKDEE